MLKPLVYSNCVFSFKLLYSFIFISVVCVGLLLVSIYWNNRHVSLISYQETASGAFVSTTSTSVGTATSTATLLTSNSIVPIVTSVTDIHEVEGEKIKVLVVAVVIPDN